MTEEKRQNEAALVCAAQRRDKEALQLLLIRNWSWLKGLVYSIINDAGEVDDVLQDICVRVITKIDSLREPERSEFPGLMTDPGNNVFRNVDWYSFTDEEGNQWLIEGLRENIVRPAAYSGDL